MSENLAFKVIMLCSIVSAQMRHWLNTFKKVSSFDSELIVCLLSSKKKKKSAPFQKSIKIYFSFTCICCCTTMQWQTPLCSSVKFFIPGWKITISPCQINWPGSAADCNVYNQSLKLTFLPQLPTVGESGAFIYYKYFSAVMEFCII